MVSDFPELRVNPADLSFAPTVARFLGANETGWEMLPPGWEPATRSRWGIVRSLAILHLA